MNEISDENLMQAYCDGDAAAFDQLYTRHRGSLYRYIKRLASNSSDIDALFQDCWLKVIDKRAQWHIDEAFKPWLFRLTHNHLIDIWRKDRHYQFDNEIEPDDHIDPTPTLDTITLLRDCVERLMALIGQLPDVQRSAFLLKEEAGLSLAQIGSVTGAERETVKSRLRYAGNRLRHGLEGCDG